MMYATLWANEKNGGCRVFKLDKRGNPSPYDVDIKILPIGKTPFFEDGAQGAA